MTLKESKGRKTEHKIGLLHRQEGRFKPTFTVLRLGERNWEHDRKESNLVQQFALS